MADRPPHTDLPHGRQQHLVDAGGQAQRRRRLVESGPDRRGIQPFGSVEDLLDQLLRRSLPAQHPAHGLGRVPAVLTAGDLVTHQPQGIDLVGQIPAVLTGPAAQVGMP